MYATDGNIRFVLRDTGGTASLANIDFPGERFWHHYAGTWDGSAMRVYLDGIEVPSAQVAFSGPLQDGDNIIVLGGQWENGINPTGNITNNSDTAMDDVRIYTRALSASEILSLSSGSRGALACGKAGSMQFNEALKSYEYCDGTLWRAIGTLQEMGSGCSGTTLNAGNMDFVSGIMTYCNGQSNVEIK